MDFEDNQEEITTVGTPVRQIAVFLPNRAGALLDALPGGQRILTTAAGLPPAAQPDQILRIHDSTVTVER